MVGCMRDFSGSTLWRVSEFERQKPALEAELADSSPTLLPTTLLIELRQIEKDPLLNDVLEVAAACLRHREAVLLIVACGALAWPLTLFPHEGLVHSPRDFVERADAASLAGLRLIDLRRPLVRPPGHLYHERVAAPAQYRPLSPLLWALALHGPRAMLLQQIAGRAAYRLAAGPSPASPPPGALAPAVQRLRLEAAALRDIARWPGMSIERACRMLNALYLTESLIVTRSHPAARDEPHGWRVEDRRRN